MAEKGLEMALADIHSGSPELLYRGLQRLAIMVGRLQTRGWILTRLSDTGTIELFARMLDCAAFHAKVSLGIMHVFRKLCIKEPIACGSLLLETGILLVTFDAFDAATVLLSDNSQLYISLEIVANISTIGSPLIPRLVESGVYEKCVLLLAEAVSRPQDVSSGIFYVLARAVNSMLCQDSAFPFASKRTLFPLLAKLLQMTHFRAPGYRSALALIADCWPEMLPPVATTYNDWILASEAGVPRVLLDTTLLDASARSAANVLITAATHGNDAVVSLVFQSETMQAIAVLAATRTDMPVLQMLTGLFSALSRRSLALRDAFEHYDLFGNTLRHLAGVLRSGDVVSPEAWQVCVDATVAIHGFCTHGGFPSASALRVLTSAGAADFICAALSNPGAYAHSLSRRFVTMLAATLRTLVDAGGVAYDAGFALNGQRPSNEWLALFCEAGLYRALTEALEHHEEALDDPVVDALNATVGQILGVRIGERPARAVPPELQVLDMAFPPPA